MAKVRVYELAKELNMTNKALLSKMGELAIEVKSHMSSLDDGTVRKIKRQLFGKSQKEFDDVKVKPSVIRRRKATQATSFEEDDDGDSAQEAAAEQGQDAPLPDAAAVPGAEKDDSESLEQESGPLETQKESDTPQDKVQKEEKRPKSKTKKPSRKKFESAKIVKPVVEKETQEESPATKPDEATMPESAGIQDTKAFEHPPEPEVEQDMPAKEEPVVSKEAKEDSADQIDKAEKGLIQDTGEDKPSPDAAAAEKKARKKKKKKKTEPAKIVKPADSLILDNLRKTRAQDMRTADSPDAREQEAGEKKSESKGGKPGRKVGARALDQPMEALIPPQDDSDRTKRKKDRKKDDLPGDAAGRKKQRKKKSVVEKEDLYGGSRGRKKRGKKDVKSGKSKFQKTQITTPKAIKRRIKVDDAIELSELAKRMGIKANEMITKLMGMGVMATVNQTIDFETAQLVAAEFDFEVERASFEEENLLKTAVEEEDDVALVHCAPIVTIMGHVDHGKTSLLDVIRKSKITADEAGGITQHIGAYNVETQSGRITFLDTPGHEAFTAMRSRGAKITDIVVLVVAADDGVMPQTIEAINHSKAAGVPVVVAINKMDKAGADPERIMRELAEFDLLSEEWGGDVIFVKVSAKEKTGIDELMEMILLQSEVLELKANPDRKALGYVVESRLDTGRGAVATVLVKQGTLKDNEPIVCGMHHGKIRAMIDDTGQRIYEAGPSTPVEIVGLNGLPDAGDEFIAVSSDKDAKQISDHRQQKQRAKELAKKSRANLEKMFENLGSEEIKELKLIVKADVHGSIEALNDSLKKLAKDEVDIKIIHSAAGTINESDISLAAVSDAIIIGFNVRPTPQVRKLARDENVDMRFYNIIYDVINDIQAAMDGLMPSTFHENIIGRAEVRETFVVPKIGTIAGSFVLDGKVTRGKKVRLLRDGIIKCDTQLSSLKRFKDDVKVVDQGYECGIGLEKFNDIKVNDIIECYEVEERKYGE